MMPSLTLNIVYNGKVIFIICISILLAFFIAMDTHLYFTLQSTVLVNQDPPIVGSYSPFKPLSIKLLMTDPMNQYVFGPSSEYFDEWTNFSKVFYFITPNMISFTHVAISFLAAKFVSSESLCTRRLGVLVYQLRSWLDDLDGVVYRSHSQTKGQYQSNHGALGYYVDIYSDIVGGVALSFGYLFYLFKSSPGTNSTKNYMPLPLTKPADSRSLSPNSNGSPSKAFSFNLSFLNIFPSPEPPNGVPFSKKYIFFKVLSFGILMAFAGGTWDRVVEKYTDIFQTNLHDTELTQIQTEALHSGSMWMVIYLWRIFEGQALLHFVLLSIFLDRVWEFLNFFQVLGWFIIFVLNVLSYIHINHVRGELNMY